MLSRASFVLRQTLARPATREARNARRLLAHTALFGIVNGGVINFLPVLLIRLGASTLVVSMLTSLPALLTIGFALPAGIIVARWRDMTRLSARCFYALRLAYIPMALAMLLGASLAPYLIVAIWALTAIPGTLGNTAFYDVVTSAVPPQRRASINGLRWALLGLFSAASVSLFGQLLEWLPWPGNYVLMFAICFVAGFISSYSYSRIETPLREPAEPALAQASWRARLAGVVQPLLARTGFGSFAVVTFVMRVGLYLPAGLVAVFLVRQLGVSEAWIGMRTTIEQGALTLGYFFWGRLANSLGQRRLLAIGVLAIGGGFAVLAQATAQALWLVLVAALITGFFSSALDVSLFEWLVAVMPAGERPRYVAMNTLLMNLVAFGGPMVGATLAERVSIPFVLVVAAICLAGCAMLIGLLWLLERRRPDRPDVGLSTPQPVSAMQATPELRRGRGRQIPR